MNILVEFAQWLRAKRNLHTEHECVPYVTDFIAGTAACRICGRDMTGENDG